jgi:hypothetical protein
MVKTKENLSGGGLSRRGSCLLAAVSRNDDFSDGFSAVEELGFEVLSPLGWK